MIILKCVPNTSHFLHCLTIIIFIFNTKLFKKLKVKSENNYKSTSMLMLKTTCNVTNKSHSIKYFYDLIISEFL